MWPLSKILTGRKDFNTVIEGAYHDNLREPNFKIARIEIPENTTILNDGTYKYKLYGKTEDFKNVQRTNGEEGELEAKIDFLGFCEGVVIPYEVGNENTLERPRAVCMQDGRLYVEENMATSKVYIKALTPIIKSAGEIFSRKDLSMLYDIVTNS